MCCSLIPKNSVSAEVQDCCCLHDELYADLSVSRKAADEIFYTCLLRHTSKEVAKSMYVLVRSFGWIWRIKTYLQQWY